jgi:hypothetical protein
MSFVGPPFEHDFFFSYAHADVDGTGDAEIKTWCQKFANDVRQALRRFPEFAVLSLYLDESRRTGERLDETAELTPALRKAAGNAALLCAMMSPWYLKSEWCAKERDWWHEDTRTLAPTIASGFDRAFICRLMDTLEHEWPEIFKDPEDITKKGFWLYDRAKPIYEQVPWGWIGNETDKAAYRQCVIEVSGRLGDRLKDIKARLDEDRRVREALAKLRQPTGQVLSLYTRPDLRDPFDDTFGRLQGVGYAVAPKAPTALLRDGRLNGDQADELRSSDAIVVLGTDDPRFDQDIVVVGRNSRRLAEALSIKPLPCAVYDLIGRDRHPERRLINAHNLGIAWIDGTTPGWVTDLRSWLRGASASAVVAASP